MDRRRSATLSETAGAALSAFPRNAIEPLALVARLCSSLKDDGVRYSHWKSTNALARSASGENDLDLLVDADDIARFEGILAALGFKEAIPRTPRRVPGVRHFYGLDEASGRLIDVHAHEQLVIGDDATKNYRLPIEDAYLASSILAEPFPVPAPEFEFVLLVIRLILKHGTLDAILTLRGSLSVDERRELEYLSELADPNDIDAVLREHLPVINPDLFYECMRSLRSGAPVMMRVRTGRELRRRLAPCGRRPIAVDAWLQLWRRASRRFRRRVLGDELHSHPATGGKVIALVGGDGAGKTSALRGLSRWLSGPLAANTLHLGKPRRSFAWLAVRSAARVERHLRTDRPGGGVPTIRSPWLLTCVLTARDRYRAATRARALADRGSIVLCDRYPLPEVMGMDGPRSDDIVDGEPRSSVARRLAKLEHAYYRRIPRPDVVVVLRVSPDVAVARRAGDDPGIVRARSEEIIRADWNSIGAEVVDADLLESEVLAQIKSHVWSRL